MYEASSPRLHQNVVVTLFTGQLLLILDDLDGLSPARSDAIRAAAAARAPRTPVRSVAVKRVRNASSVTSLSLGPVVAQVIELTARVRQVLDVA